MKIPGKKKESLSVFVFPGGIEIKIYQINTKMFNFDQCHVDFQIDWRQKIRTGILLFVALLWSSLRYVSFLDKL